MVKTIVTRTPYMQRLLTSTYSMVAVEAIKGGFDGSWERLIAKRLISDYENDHSEAVEIMNSFFSMCIKSIAQASVKAAYLITSSKILKCHT